MTTGTLFSPTSSLTPESPTLEDAGAHGQMKDAHLTNFLFNQTKKAFTVLGQKNPTMLEHFTPAHYSSWSKTLDINLRPEKSSVKNKSDLNTDEQEN